MRWTQALIYVRRSHVQREDNLPKSHRVRSVPLTDQAAAALDRLSRREGFTWDDDRVFVNDQGGPVEESALPAASTRRWTPPDWRCGDRLARCHRAYL